MYAAKLHAPGAIESAPLVYEQVDEPLPGRGEVAIEVTACGVCRSNLHVAEGDWMPDSPAFLPIIPGHEVVGRVSRLGEIIGTDVTWAADGEIQSAPIVRRQLGLDGNLEGIGLDTLSWAGTTVYRNPFRGTWLSDEEIAIATCLYEATDPDGPSGYSLADGCEDRYLSLLIGLSAARRAPVVAEAQPWTQALSPFSQLL